MNKCFIKEYIIMSESGKKNRKYNISTPRLVVKHQVKQKQQTSEKSDLSHEAQELNKIMHMIPPIIQFTENQIIENSPQKVHNEMKKLHNWTLGKPISHSQSAVIYKAIHNNTGALAAIKKLIYDEKDKQDHQKQLEVLCKINHKNIVKYMHHLQHKNQTLIFMEYVPTTLKNYLQIYGILPTHNYLKFAKQIISAVDYLHNNKIVHKDLKCSNILLDNDATVKISDFGCSKSFDKTLSLNNYEKEGCRTFKGSILWMAPEVIKDNIYNRKTDIWSLGCTLLELATSKSPWHQKKFDNEMSAVWVIAKEGELPQIPEHLHIEIKKLLKSCINRNPDQRLYTKELLELQIFSLIQ